MLSKVMKLPTRLQIRTLAARWNSRKTSICRHRAVVVDPLRQQYLDRVPDP
jgi:hypothetical protein